MACGAGRVRAERPTVRPCQRHPDGTRAPRPMGSRDPRHISRSTEGRDDAPSHRHSCRSDRRPAPVPRERRRRHREAICRRAGLEGRARGGGIHLAATRVLELAAIPSRWATPRSGRTGRLSVGIRCSSHPSGPALSASCGTCHSRFRCQARPTRQPCAAPRARRSCDRLRRTDDEREPRRGPADDRCHHVREPATPGQRGCRGGRHHSGGNAIVASVFEPS